MTIERTKERISQTGEIFTPEVLVEEILDKLPSEVWSEGKTFCDPAAGDGNFLVAVLKRKLEKKHNPTEALKTIFGVELMEDNVAECKKRLLDIVGNTEEHELIVNQNIVCADALKYDFSFGDRDDILEF